MANEFEVNPIDPTPVEPTPSVVIPEAPKPPMTPPQAPQSSEPPSTPVPPPPTPPVIPPSNGEGFFSKLSPVKWIIGIVVFAAIAILLVSVFSRSFRESGIVLEVEGPEQIQSGAEVTYKVVYKNNSDTRLENVSLNFLYPGDAVVVKDGQIRESLTENVDIEDLGSGDEGEIEFKAYVVGEAGDSKVAKVRLSYQPANIRSEFDKAAELSTMITSFAIPLTLSAPPSAISGQTVMYTLDYRNESDEDFDNLRILFKYPEGFTPVEFNPSPDEGSDVWEIDSLRKGEGSRISVTGNLIGREGVDKVAVVNLQREIGGNNVDFEKATITTRITSPPLLIDLSVNNKTNFIAKPGDDLEYVINFSNTSRSTLSGVNLIARIDGDAHDVGSYKGDGFFNSNDNSIIWNASVVPVLADFQPGQSGEVSFKLKVKDNLPVSFIKKNFFVKVTASLETTNVPKEFDLDKLVVSQDLLTKISTNINFNQSAYYNDPAAGFTNSGPVPPKVGQQTTYTIHWTLGDTSNDIVGAKVIAFLPPGVSWTGNTTVNANQPAVTFDPATGQVSWNIQVVPAGTGIVLPRYQAIFQVAINPTDAQKSQPIELVKEARFEGQDGFTKEQIDRFAFPLSTDLVVDQPGKGAVE